MGSKTIPTNWIVITGGPCSGKTSVVNLLAERGYQTATENARHYIDMLKVSGKSVEEIRQNKAAFQLAVLDMQLKQEQSLDTNELVFLDRALPDAIAYYRFFDLEYDKRLIEQCSKYHYRQVFILDRLPLTNDYARLEVEAEQIRIHELIIAVYQSFSWPIVFVPVLPLTERVEFILDKLNHPVPNLKEQFSSRRLPLT